MNWKATRSNFLKRPFLQLYREHDEFLAQVFARQKYPKYQLSQLNRCQVYLRFTTISDIVSGNGDYILPNFTDVAQPSNPRAPYSSLKWPEQGQPSESAWSLWRRALRECLSADNSY